MLVANKAVVIGVRAYGPGEVVDAAGLDGGKVQQLIAQRVLRDAGLTPPFSCVVLRDVRVNGKRYARGTVVNAARLPPAKVAQMLDHRILGLAP
jgi:hypothetical protein